MTIEYTLVIDPSNYTPKKMFFDIEASLTDALTQGARIAEAQFQINLSGAGSGELWFDNFNPSSIPGEYPALQTGFLRDSVFADLTDFTITLGNDAEYSQDLVDSGRLFAEETLAEVFPEINELIGENLVKLGEFQLPEL